VARRKTRVAPVPMQIRHEVNTILRHAAKNNGITSAAILFVNDKGELRGRGNGSDVFSYVIQQAVENFGLIHSTALRAFNDGWDMAETGTRKVVLQNCQRYLADTPYQPIAV
jgi:hypothetical protein